MNLEFLNEEKIPLRKTVTGIKKQKQFLGVNEYLKSKEKKQLLEDTLKIEDQKEYSKSGYENIVNKKKFNLRKHFNEKAKIESEVTNICLCEAVNNIFFNSLDVFLKEHFIELYGDNIKENGNRFLLKLFEFNINNIVDKFKNNNSGLVRDVYKVCNEAAKKQLEDVLIKLNKENPRESQILKDKINPAEVNLTRTDGKMESDEDMFKDQYMGQTGEVKDKAKTSDGVYKEIKDFRDRIVDKAKTDSSTIIENKLFISPIITKIKDKVFKVLSKERDIAISEDEKLKVLQTKENKALLEHYEKSKKNFTLFKKMFMHNLKKPLKEFGIFTESKIEDSKVHDKILAETIVDYTLLETLNTMNLISFNEENNFDNFKKIFSI